jgi:hypothetical protein
VVAAGIVLLVMGLLLTLAAVVLVALVVGGEGPFGQIDPPANAGQALFSAIAVAVIVLGPALIHIAAAIGIFGRKDWGRLLGLVTAWLGLVVGLMVLIARLNAQPLLPALAPTVVAVLAYGFTFAALLLRSEHFTQRRAAR